MANATPKLEKRKDVKTGQVINKNVPIVIDFTFDGKRMWVQTGEKIDEVKWDNKNYRVKSSANGSREINDLIKSKCDQILKIYRDAKILGNEPTVAYVRNMLNSNKIDTHKSLWQLFDEYIEGHKIRSSPNTVKILNTNKKHLENFSKKVKLSLDFNIIDEPFLNKYVDYLQNHLKHTNGTIAKEIRVLKQFLNWAAKLDYNRNLVYKAYIIKSYEPEIVILTGPELFHLYNYDFKNDCYNQVRDAFCFSCFTCLRYSDVKALKKTDIQDDYIRITSIKTKSSVNIPLIAQAKAILERNNKANSRNALFVISNQKMNDYLKEICAIASLDRLVTKTRYRGSLKIEKTQPLHEVVTTHIGRKTGISYLFYMGLDSELIRSISNHKSISSFARYNKIADDHKAREMKKAFSKFGDFENEKSA